MQISSELSEKAVLKELAERLARYRVELDLTQEQAAEFSGMGKRTLERIESGEDFRISNFIKLLRTLKLLDVLDKLIPPEQISPIQLLDLSKGRKKRASASRELSSKEEWHWSDEK